MNILFLIAGLIFDLPAPRVPEHKLSSFAPLAVPLQHTITLGWAPTTSVACNLAQSSNLVNWRIVCAVDTTSNSVTVPLTNAPAYFRFQCPTK